MSGPTTRTLEDCVAAHLPPDLPRGAATDALGRELVTRGELGAVEHALDRFGGLGHDAEQLMQECWPMMATGGVAARDPTLRRAANQAGTYAGGMIRAVEKKYRHKKPAEVLDDLVARETFGERFVTKVLGRQLVLS